MRVYNLLLLTFLLAPLIIVASARKISRADCSNRANDVFFSDPESCSCFYVCRNGRPVRRHCGRGLNFDQKTLTCNIAALVDCPRNIGIDIVEPFDDITTETTPCPTTTCASTDTTPCPTTTCANTDTPPTTCSTTPTTTTCTTIPTTTGFTTPTTTTCTTIPTTTGSTTPTTTTCTTIPTTTGSTTPTTTTCTTIPTTTDSTTPTTTTCTTIPTTTCSTAPTTSLCSTIPTTTPCSTIPTTTPCSTTTCPTTTCLTTGTTPLVSTQLSIMNFMEESRDCTNYKDGTFLLDKKHCRRFYVCFQGKAKHLKCTVGNWFDRETQVCRNRYEVNNCPAQRN